MPRKETQLKNCICLLWTAGLVCAAPISDTYSVRDFGAKGDGKTDDTAAFQKALDTAGQGGGGVVYAPRGNYFFAGHLSVPNAVTLKGLWDSVPAHVGLRDAGAAKPTDDGTTFLVTESAGKEDGTAFITLNNNSTLRGVVIYYPEQDSAEEPKPYPWAIAMRGKNPAVLAVELLNPYNGIDASQNERHLIRDVQGQPLRRGVYVDSIYDIGRIENVHFNPWWSMKPKLFQWQQQHGEAFIFGRTDWQYVFNTFCFGYNVGYKFMQTAAGVCNGNFLGIGADDCYTALVVENCAPMALLISNGEFVSFHGPDPTMVRVEAANSGSVRLVNCAFWHGRIYRLQFRAVGSPQGGAVRAAGDWRDRASPGLRVSSRPAANRTGREGAARGDFGEYHHRQTPNRESQQGDGEYQQQRERLTWRTYGSNEAVLVGSNLNEPAGWLRRISTERRHLHPRAQTGPWGVLCRHKRQRPVVRSSA
jgi:hypothetical protein